MGVTQWLRNHSRSLILRYSVSRIWSQECRSRTGVGVRVAVGVGVTVGLGVELAVAVQDTVGVGVRLIGAVDSIGASPSSDAQAIPAANASMATRRRNQNGTLAATLRTVTNPRRESIRPQTSTTL